MVEERTSKVDLAKRVLEGYLRRPLDVEQTLLSALCRLGETRLGVVGAAAGAAQAGTGAVGSA